MSHREAGEKTTNERAGDLAHLVSVEQELEQRLEQARVEARELVAAAGRECESLTNTYEAEAASERTLLQARVAQEQQAQERVILAEGRERAARYDGLPESTVAELAAVVLDFVLRGSPE